MSACEMVEPSLQHSRHQTCPTYSRKHENYQLSKKEAKFQESKLHSFNLLKRGEGDQERHPKLLG